MFKKNEFGLVYALVDERTDTICYVGKAVDPASRRSGHQLNLARNTHHNNRLQNIFNKLQKEGEHGLAWLPLEWIHRDKLTEAERQWIARLRALGYDLCNATNGGEGACGRAVSIATRQKMRDAHSGQQPSELCKARAREVNATRVRTEEERLKRGMSMRGNRHGIKNLVAWNERVKTCGLSDEHKLHLSIAKRNGGVARGARQHLSKLTEEQVVEIRSLYESGMGSRKIGRMFNISPAAAWCIKTRKTWAHVA